MNKFLLQCKKYFIFFSFILYSNIYLGLNFTSWCRKAIFILLFKHIHIAFQEIALQFIYIDIIIEVIHILM